MSKLLFLAAGGAVGTLLRYLVAGLTHRFLDASFPWGTLVANLLGCLAIGFLWALTERAPLSPRTSLFLFTGVLGAFTTFSTYGLETYHLLRTGEHSLGLANVLASNLLGLAGVLLGFAAARLLLTLSSRGETP